MKAARFTDHTENCDWETLAQRHFLKRTVENGLGKLYATGCEGLLFE